MENYRTAMTVDITLDYSDKVNLQEDDVPFAV
jgi:hypothetical protein